MSTPEIIAIVLGGLSSVSLIISALSTSRPRLLVFAIICSIFAIGQFLLLGAVTAAVVIAVGVIRNSLLLLSIKKEKLAWLGSWFMMVFFILVSATAWTVFMEWDKFEPLMVVPLVSNIMSSVAVFFKNLIYTKSIFLVVSTLWFSYDLTYGAYGALAGEAANFIANGIALTLLVRAAISGKAVIDPTTEVIKTITTAIPAVTAAITTAIPVVTSANKVVKRDPLLAETGETRAMK